MKKKLGFNFSKEVISKLQMRDAKGGDKSAYLSKIRPTNCLCQTNEPGCLPPNDTDQSDCYCGTR